MLHEMIVVQKSFTVPCYGDHRQGPGNEDSWNRSGTGTGSGSSQNSESHEQMYTFSVPLNLGITILGTSPGDRERSLRRDILPDPSLHLTSTRRIRIWD